MNKEYLQELQRIRGTKRYELLRIRHQEINNNCLIFDIVESFDCITKKVMLLWINDQGRIIKKEIL